MTSLFLAATEDMFQGANFWFTMIWVFIAIMSFSFITLLANRFKRCPSNRILVIYGMAGKGQAVKCYHGGGTFVWPLIQDCDYLNLEPIQIEIPLRGALSSENIRVNVPSVFTVAIGTTPEVMNNAAIRLLGLKRRVTNNILEVYIWLRKKEGQNQKKFGGASCWQA